MHGQQQELETLRWGRKRSQEADCFPECLYKCLSNGSISTTSVSPVVQSTQGRGCWLTCPAVLQPPKHSSLCLPGKPDQGIDLAGKKKMLQHSAKSNMFFFPARITSPIWPASQLHKQLRQHSSGADRE